MNCRRCQNEIHTDEFDAELCDDCDHCLDCGKTAEEADIQHAQCPDCWARDMREEMRADRSLGSW